MKTIYDAVNHLNKCIKPYSERVRTKDEGKVLSDAWLFVFVSLVTGLICRERRMTGGYMGHNLCLLLSLLCLETALYVCAHNVEREVWAQGLCMGKCCNLCVFLLALSVFTRIWVKPWFWGCLSAQNVAWLFRALKLLSWIERSLHYFLCFCFLCMIIRPTLWYTLY